MEGKKTKGEHWKDSSCCISCRRFIVQNQKSFTVCVGFFGTNPTGPLFQKGVEVPWEEWWKKNCKIYPHSLAQKTYCFSRAEKIFRIRPFSPKIHYFMLLPNKQKNAILNFTFLTALSEVFFFHKEQNAPQCNSSTPAPLQGDSPLL